MSKDTDIHVVFSINHELSLNKIILFRDEPIFQNDVKLSLTISNGERGDSEQTANEQADLSLPCLHM